MFENVGGKLKVLAQVIFYIELIVIIFIGILLLGNGIETLWIAVLVIVVGGLLAWISSWFLYGFGEIVDKVGKIEENTRNQTNTPQTIYKEEKTGRFAYLDNQKSNMEELQEKQKRIGELNNLLYKGLITQEEYDQAISKK